jgi:hypothetical protein
LYNLARTHSGIEGLVPADRFFEAAPEVLKTMQSRLATNALELARHGVPKKPFYLTGQLDGKPFSVHQEGDRVILRKAGEDREQIDLARPPQSDLLEPPTAQESLPDPLCPDGSPQTAWNPPDVEPAPGVSALDEFLPHWNAERAPSPEEEDDEPQGDEPQGDEPQGGGQSQEGETP